jgi:hypothetical protein
MVEQMIALADDDDKIAQLATTLVNGLDGLNRQIDKHVALMDRTTDKFFASIERQAKSSTEMIEVLSGQVEALAARVAVLEAESKARAQGPN